MRKTNDLGRDPVFRLVCRLAIPTMLAQLVSVLYSIVDRIYIGNIQGPPSRSCGWWSTAPPPAPT